MEVDNAKTYMVFKRAHTSKEIKHRKDNVESIETPTLKIYSIK